MTDRDEEVIVLLQRIAMAVESLAAKGKRKAEQGQLVPKPSAKDLVEGFMLSGEQFSQIKAKFPSVLPYAELEDFRTYYRSNGYKVGKVPLADPWAAFQNWCKRFRQGSRPALARGTFQRAEEKKL